MNAVADFQLTARTAASGIAEGGLRAEADIRKIDLVLPAKTGHLAAEGPWIVELQCSGRTSERNLAARAVVYFKGGAVGDGVRRGIDRRIGQQRAAAAIIGQMELANTKGTVEFEVGHVTVVIIDRQHAAGVRRIGGIGERGRRLVDISQIDRLMQSEPGYRAAVFDGLVEC